MKDSSAALQIRICLFALFATIATSATEAFGLIDKTTEVMDRERLLYLIRENPQATTLDQIPRLLPEEFLMNFVLKHGVKRSGERGHLVETKVSQSSDPLLPRAIIWDERTGFTVSYNGGGAQQSAAQRLDIMSFDSEKKTFHMEQIDFPIGAGKPVTSSSDCATCHGPSHRPIFSMYPDWPSFYGSDNDELTGKPLVQQKEFTDYRKFLAEVAPRHPRYSPLYSNARVQKYLGRKLYPSFPYRPDTATDAQNVSRAFAFRPELRLGILYNRLNAQNITARVMQHERYDSIAPLFLFNLLQCAWTPQSAKEVTAWNTSVEKLLGRKPRTLSGGLIDYRHLWAIFGLRVNDVDIRYSYNHEGYKNDDASKKVMEVGYIGRYYNSYFDGSATIDELVSANLYADLVNKHPRLKGLAQPWGLVAKYKHLSNRYKLDEAFFKQMDSLGRWIHIPYPKQLAGVHHRERFKDEFQKTHSGLCRSLEEIMKTSPTP